MVDLLLRIPVKSRPLFYKFTPLPFKDMVNDENGLITALSYDGVHPNKEGFILMSNLVDKAIAQTLKSVR